MTQNGVPDAEWSGMSPEPETAPLAVRELLVLKFGGKTLGDPVRIQQLAQHVLRLQATHDLLIVVSAMGNQTSELIDIATAASGEHPDPQDLITVAAQGEITSAFVFKAALTAFGGRAAAIVPGDPRWPLLVRELGGQSLAASKVNQQVSVELEEDLSRDRARDGLQRLIAEGVIPVVTGFLAETTGGRLTTLGRGGSDVTAFMLAKLCAANQVIIITDTPGILQADPRVVAQPTTIRHLTIEEIDSMAKAGAQVLHPKSLEYKTDRFKARVVHYDEPDYATGGTEISGFYRALLRSTPQRLTMLTLVGHRLFEANELLGQLGRLVRVAELPLYGISLTEGFLAVYLPEDRAVEVYRQLSTTLADWPAIKSLVIREGIARLNIASPKFIDAPGVLEQIMRPLATEGINVLEVITSQADITLFVDWGDRQKTWTILKKLATDLNMDEMVGQGS